MFLETIHWRKESLKDAGLLFLFIFIAVKSFSQGDSLHKDTAKILAVEPKSKVSGQVRYFFMSTDNQDPLSDYYAHAISAQAKYERGLGKYFRIAAGASANYNISSSDLARADSIAKRPNRYEVQLFDLLYPNRKSIYRLEEFYIQAALRNGTIRLGSQSINTPFINPQDGRMRPTFVSGIYTTLSFRSMQVQGGWIGGMLPRSISGWHSVGSSIGLNPQGINTDGTASNYGGHLSSNGIFLVGITRRFSPSFKVKLWEQYVDKIFNTALLQADLEHKLCDKTKFVFSLQYTNQLKIKNGGSNEMTKGYFTSNTPAQVISTMTGIESERFEASLNYTRIFKGARFLMPREWGREPFFTFMPRERNEGFGDVQSIVIKTAYNFKEGGFKFSLQAGQFQLPDVKNVALNKYGMPSYNQLNAEVRYIPKTAPKLDLQFLYVYKDNKGNTYQNPGYVFNKVNMGQYNLVVNYNW
jgi:hypothetical protein